MIRFPQARHRVRVMPQLAQTRLIQGGRAKVAGFFTLEPPCALAAASPGTSEVLAKFSLGRSRVSLRAKVVLDDNNYKCQVQIHLLYIAKASFEVL